MMAFFTWVHLLAAMMWIGGMLFLSLVLAPVLRRPSLAQYGPVLFPVVARQFRWMAWGALGLLFTTGPFLAQARGIVLSEPGTWPGVFKVKLALIALLVMISLGHDLIVGPRVSSIRRKAEHTRSHGEVQLVRWAPLLARGSLVFALAVLYCAVQLART